MRLRYGGVRDAIDKLGDPDKIKNSFEDLQIKISNDRVYGGK